MATRCAKRQVEMDSSSWSGALVMFATITVRQLPELEPERNCRKELKCTSQ